MFEELKKIIEKGKVEEQYVQDNYDNTKIIEKIERIL